MLSCPDCLAELEVDPLRQADALAATLARGGFLPLPAGRRCFQEGPDCTLLRVQAHSALVFIGADGFLEAAVAGASGRAEPPLECRDIEGVLLFELRSYTAADRALEALGADGAAMGTFLADDALLHAVVDVRDETSAPVARLTRSLRGGGGYDLVEIGGGRLARLTRTDAERDGWVDDRWSLGTERGVSLPLEPLAAVALVLAAKVFLGRSTPSPVQPQLVGDEAALGSDYD